jgi:hypothetical protein
MFWPNKLLVSGLFWVFSSGLMAEDSVGCRDPFYPLYIQHPRNDYEMDLSKRAKAQQSDAGRVQMVICGKAPMVVIAGKTYQLGDPLMNGTIVEITCDHLVTQGENTQTVIHFVERGLIEKREAPSE